MTILILTWQEQISLDRIKDHYEENVNGFIKFYKIFLTPAKCVGAGETLKNIYVNHAFCIINIVFEIKLRYIHCCDCKYNFRLN